ncbi:DeoR family transcriptional regulator [Gracilibacillus salitolerans]|uniref:DeoR family transcriptional regulator n=1 Tax=Gracilibacillus salitolerans TaxID=2663022 RepID=A0A5Q2TNJ6_9BACI|nr:DeoR/GlpR family DNA-binding transcription regulator [Gracilibacillus salitolerans]QGH36376.1 DeoR family transcriptional regulator [Gracilibacillus salitolerans]
MLAPSRRKKIIQILNEKKQLLVKDTSREFGVSEGTLRNDLKILEEEGFLVKTHGGAMLPEQYAPNLAFRSRVEQNQSEKKLLSNKAMEQIEGKYCITIDASSTCLELAKQLVVYKKNLTVITNGLVTAQILAENTSLNVIMIGGLVRPGSTEIEGSLGKTILSEINSDIFFTSPHGFTVESGLNDFSVHEAQLKKYMAERAEKCVAVVDHTKINRKSVVTSLETNDIDVLITSDQAPQGFLEKLKNQYSTIHLVTVKQRKT